MKVAKRVLLFLMLTIVYVVFASPAFSQERSSTTQSNESSETRKLRQSSMGIVKFLPALDLSEDQQKQVNAILERFRGDTAAQRNELRQASAEKRSGEATNVTKEKTLRLKLHEAETKMRLEILAVLTPRQKTELEQIMRQFREKNRL